jgi:hypothetical protein
MSRIPCTPATIITSLRKVRLDRGGYDPDGRYWGAAINGTPPLFRAEADDGAEIHEEYVRAWDRTDARAKLLKACPRLKFKRP